MMKCRFLLLFALGVVASPAWSLDSRPSDASIHQLIDVMQARKLIDNLTSQLNGMMLKSAAQASGGVPMDAGEQEIVNRGVERLADLVKQQLAWSEMEPMLIDIYQKNFTQKEVDDLLAFYKSPSGQAVIQKMPLVMQQSMAVSQTKMQGMLPQIRQIDAQMVRELRAYRETHQAPAKQ